MRWIWIDKLTELKSGEYSRGIKNISLAEEHLHDHFPGSPRMPNSLVLEGLAQTGGILVAEAEQFVKRVILAKVNKAVFHFDALPGESLLYTAKLLSRTLEGAQVSATSHSGERLQAECELMFAFLSEEVMPSSAFPAKDVVRHMRHLGLCDLETERPS